RLPLPSEIGRFTAANEERRLGRRCHLRFLALAALVFFRLRQLFEIPIPVRKLTTSPLRRLN
ncbi:unnamed protein product, partial [Ixodes pacificus]